MHGGHVVQEASVLLERDDLVGHRHQPLADITHEQNTTARVPGDPDDGLVETVRAAARAGPCAIP